MVSTRGVKLKFVEGERVLCYEPDPTKAKVLYDSKVLNIIVNKDQKGKKSIEYLIHFQGWNSSWDRCVGEEFVLKDTPENRQLQKDLAEKSQLHLGAYLYRKERKKNRKTSSSQSVSMGGPASEDGSSGSPTRPDTDTTSGDESSVEDETIHIDLSDDLRIVLEHDYTMIQKKKLLKLPAEPNAYTILEMYWKHYATNQICGLNEKPSSRYRVTQNQQVRVKPEDIQKNLNLCKEILDGIRIYFDSIVNEYLLYPDERNHQVNTKIATYLSPSDSYKIEIKSDESHHENQQTNHRVHSDDINKNGMSHCNDSGVNQRRRTLRSNHKQETLTNGNTSTEITNNNIVKPCSSVGSSNSDVTGPLNKALSWQLLPEHVHHQRPPPPCLVYGAVHLLRLFVKLPMFLANSNITDAKMKILLRHFELFLDFMSEHKEWYDDKFYCDVA